ncbi:MAG: ATP-binding cassette domain-containing protein, partial [Coriobacteriia bacterium]|nr:ATP-binding cassette domain-containing protein [Coriobacteriia bacterium]
GAGKSTLVDMIPLLRRPTSGAIRFDGIPAGDYDLASLRTRIGFLTQEPILFNDTIEANLTYGLGGDVSDERIRRALEDSYCAEFVDTLECGLATALGDRGVRFSGGQRQRLALARVLLQDPDILILDEPTSALDSESEAYIQKAFERIAEERTVIVIAHRLSTVEKADQIVVLADGRVAEIGTHHELLENDGQYRRLFDQQIRA